MIRKLLSDQNQEITNISIDGDYTESGVYSDLQNSDPILYTRWKKDFPVSAGLNFSYPVLAGYR